MKKYLRQNLWVILLIITLVSCGKDDKVLPFDKNLALGDYSGTCTVNYGKETAVIEDYPAEFMMNSLDRSSLSATLGADSFRDKDGLGKVGNVILSNFLNDRGYANFRMTGIEVEYSNSIIIPEVISNQVSSFDIKRAVLTLTCENGGQFDPNRQEISFVYKGRLEITGTQSNQQFANSVIYSFVLKKNK